MGKYANVRIRGRSAPGLPCGAILNYWTSVMTVWPLPSRAAERTAFENDVRSLKDLLRVAHSDPDDLRGVGAALTGKWALLRVRRARHLPLPHGVVGT